MHMNVNSLMEGQGLSYRDFCIDENMSWDSVFLASIYFTSSLRFFYYFSTDLVGVGDFPLFVTLSNGGSTQSVYRWMIFFFTSCKVVDFWKEASKTIFVTKTTISMARPFAPWEKNSRTKCMRTISVFLSFLLYSLYFEYSTIWNS